MLNNKHSSITFSIETLKNLIRELEPFLNVKGLKDEITAIHLALTAIKSHLESRVDNSDSRALSTSHEFKHDLDVERAGNLIALSCGHGGPYSSQERINYENHLFKSRFITNNF